MCFGAAAKVMARAVLFLAGACRLNFFGAEQPVSQLRCGLPAAVLLIVSTVMKMALLPRTETNRLMR